MTGDDDDLIEDSPCDFWDEDGCYCVCGTACMCEHQRVVDVGDDLHRILADALGQSKTRER